MAPSPFLSHSADETQAFGQELAHSYREFYGKKPVLFALQGELGTGKTHLVKGLAKGLGVQDLITSPSYTLVNEYMAPTGVPFIHIDAWRLSEPSDLSSLGWQRFLDEKAVIALEWPPEKVFAPTDTGVVVTLRLAYTNTPTERRILWEEQK